MTFKKTLKKINKILSKFNIEGGGGSIIFMGQRKAKLTLNSNIFHTYHYE